MRLPASWLLTAAEPSACRPLAASIPSFRAAFTAAAATAAACLPLRNFGGELADFQRLMNGVKRGDIVGVVGFPGKSKRGELSVFPRSLTVLAPCLHMPPGAHFGLKDQVGAVCPGIESARDGGSGSCSEGGCRHFTHIGRKPNLPLLSRRRRRRVNRARPGAMPSPAGLPACLPACSPDCPPARRRRATASAT